MTQEEKNSQLNEIYSQIGTLKAQLDSSDYKMSDYWGVKYNPRGLQKTTSLTTSTPYTMNAKAYATKSTLWKSSVTLSLKSCRKMKNQWNR